MTFPEKMYGVVLNGHGGPEMLEWRDDLPVPVAGKDDVIVRVSAAGVNNTDINTRTAWYSKGDAEAGDASWSGAPLTFPRIQGADVCGEIVAVGEAIDTARIGRPGTKAGRNQAHHHGEKGLKDRAIHKLTHRACLPQLSGKSKLMHEWPCCKTDGFCNSMHPNIFHTMPSRGTLNRSGYAAINTDVLSCDICPTFGRQKCDDTGDFSQRVAVSAHGDHRPKLLLFGKAVDETGQNIIHPYILCSIFVSKQLCEACQSCPHHT